MSDETAARIRNMRGLATLAFQRGKQVEGIRLASQVCYFAREWLGENHPEVATSLNELARMYVAIQEYATAEPIMRTALEIYERTVGPDHPSYATGLFNLAVLFHNAENLTAAESYYRQALDVQRRVLGAGHPNARQTLSNLALLYSTRSEVAAAEGMYLELLAVQRAMLGNDHEDVDATLQAIVQLHRQAGKDGQAIPFQRELVDIARRLARTDGVDYLIRLTVLAELCRISGEYDAAEPLYREALALPQIRTSGQRQMNAIVLHNLGLLCHERAQYAAAEPLLLEAQDIFREVLGPEHPQIATSLNTLGSLYTAQGSYETAERLLHEALAIRRTQLGDEAPDVATTLNNLALLHEKIGNYASAEQEHREAGRIWRSALGERHPAYATSLNNLANVLHRMGRYEDAVSLLRQALDIRHAVLGDRHPLVAASLDNLAALYIDTGDYSEAERTQQRAVAGQRASVGQEHPAYAVSLGNLAYLYQQMGRYAAAEPLYQQVLRIQQKAYGENHPECATTLNNLALLYQVMHATAEADACHRQALRIREVGLGRTHPDVAQSLNNLGALRWQTGRLAEALALYMQALQIRQEALGRQHPDVAQTLNNLATLCMSMRRDAEAVTFLRDAIAIWRTAHGGEHPSLAQGLSNLAVAQGAIGQFDEAEGLHRAALDMRRRLQGDNHPDVAQSLYNLAWNHALTGRRHEALALLRDAAAIDDHTLGQVFSIGSESQRMAYLEYLRLGLHFVLSLTTAALDNQDAVRAALDLVLRRKAIGVEVLAVQRDAILAGRYPELEPSLRELSALRARIGRTLLGGRSTDSTSARLTRVAAWERQRDQRERELAQRIPELNLEQRLRSVTSQAVAAALPPGTCLVEYVRHVAFDFASRDVKDVRYAAFVLTPNPAAKVRLIDLGPGDAIDQLIETWRRNVTGAVEAPPPNDNETTPAATDDRREIVRLAASHLGRAASPTPVNADDVGDRLRARVFDPVSAALDGCRRLFIAPDGNLALLPFEALPVTGDRCLLDEYTISYVGAGRDVLRLAATDGADAPHNSLVLSEPDYDLGAETVPAFIDDTPFPRLDGVSDEGRAVADLLHTSLIAGEQAVESRLRASTSPAIVHIATHGFFAPYEALNASDVREQILTGFSPRFDRVGFLPNPMLRSGLALAGANTWAQGGRPPAEAEDGILTAEDVTGLDLGRTDLVVLSACETGLGDVHAGEGVFGLRRAFTVAGARTLVMSLWKVPDRETQELMTRFYEALVIQGRSRIDALRDAQTAVRSRHRDPLYWGAFICQGAIGPLRRSDSSSRA